MSIDTRTPRDGVPEMLGRLAWQLAWGFARIFSIVALLAAWEILARTGTFTPFQLPALSAVLERIWSDAVSGDLAIAACVARGEGYTLKPQA